MIVLLPLKTSRESMEIIDWCVQQGFHVKYRTPITITNEQPICRVTAFHFYYLTDEQEMLFRLRWGY